MVTENSHQQSNSLQAEFGKKATDSHVGVSKPKVGGTLYRKDSSKTQMNITRTQLHEASWLFTQYGLAKPGWLRRQFISNQRRRKLLNQVLWEAGLDRYWCGLQCHSGDWSGELHKLWHQLNGVTQ